MEESWLKQLFISTSVSPGNRKEIWKEQFHCISEMRENNLMKSHELHVLQSDDNVCYHRF